jgi:hypothetical protein
VTGPCLPLLPDDPHRESSLTPTGFSLVVGSRSFRGGGLTVSGSTLLAAVLPRRSLPCASQSVTTRSSFSPTSKRRRGFASEAQVKRGDRVVHNDKELIREAGS